MFRTITRALRTWSEAGSHATRRPRRCTPQITTLEGRQLLSAAHAGFAHTAAFRSPTPHPFPPIQFIDGQPVALSAMRTTGNPSPFLIRNPSSPHPFPPIQFIDGQPVALSAMRTTGNPSPFAIGTPTRYVFPPIQHIDGQPVALSGFFMRRPWSPTDPDGDGDFDRGDFYDRD